MKAMNKNGFTLMTMMMVTVIIAVIASLVYTIIFSRAAAISSDPAISQCQQSATLAGAVRVPGVDMNVFDYACPVSSKEINSRSLDVAVSPQRLAELGYTGDQTRRYNLDKQMWQQVNDCYQKVNFGVLPLFNRQGLLSAYSDEPTYCVICSRVTFDKAVHDDFSTAKPFLDVQNFIEKATNPATGKTTFQTTQERSDVIGGTRANYNVKKTQAVVYTRTIVKAPDRLLGKLGLTCLGEFVRACTVNFEPGLLVPPDQVFLNIIAASQTNKDDYVTKDVDAVVIVDYEEQDSLKDLCTVIGNEKYNKG